MEWLNKKSSNYEDFQEFYNTKLRELYNLEKKDVKASAHLAKLNQVRQGVANIREVVANTTNTTITMEWWTKKRKYV